MATLIKNKSKFNNIPIGIVIGILTPIVVFLIFYLATGVSAGESLHDFIFKYKVRSVLPNIMSLCAIPNALLFWLFLQKGNYYTTRGIIIALFMMMLWVVVEKVF